MPLHIFFAWQSDTPKSVGRNLIERALERAIGILNADAEIELADREEDAIREELAVDRDTLNVPGMPPIVETIFGKIDRAAIFLSDMTFVAERENGSRSPNPNVLVEHGWALRSLTWRRTMAVMNTAMGHPDEHDLPFDLRHFRRPMLYECAVDADDAARKAGREVLTKHFLGALKAMLADDAVKAELHPPSNDPHPGDVALLRRVWRQIPEDTRRFLHQFDFGGTFQRSILDGIFEMNDDWVGAAYEFHDPDLQKGFAELRKHAHEFGALVAVRTYAGRSNPKTCGPFTDYDIDHGVQKSTRDAIREMNRLAGEFSKAIDDFDRLARGRIREAREEPAVAPVVDDREEHAGALLNALACDRYQGGLPEIVSLPRMTLRIVPYAAIEGRRLIPKEVVAQVLRFPPSPEERVKTGSDQRQWWSCAVPSPRPGMNPETTWLMRLVRPGALEFEGTIGWRIGDDPQILVDGRHLEGTAVWILEKMASILGDLGLGGPALISLSLEGVEDVILTRARPGGRKVRLPNIELPVARVDDIALPLAEALQEQFDMLWQAGGWEDGSPSFEGERWAGYDTPRPYSRS